VLVLRDDGDADHSGSELFAGHKPEQYADPDPDGVGNDAGRVRHIRDDLCDGSDLKDRTDDAEHIALTRLPRWAMTMRHCQIATSVTTSPAISSGR